MTIKKDVTGYSERHLEYFIESAAGVQSVRVLGFVSEELFPGDSKDGEQKIGLGWIDRLTYIFSPPRKKTEREGRDIKYKEMFFLNLFGSFFCFIFFARGGIDHVKG
jgi:hypothetical protein